MNENIQEGLEELKSRFSGKISLERTDRVLYATDASVYRELPLGVAWPKDKNDIVELVLFAKRYNTTLIPRTAGTSLAGQVVGSGLVVDVGRYMNRILHVDPVEKTVTVEPGVVLDELNQHLVSFGLFFSPETSTSNRCMIGGMVGNNACGAHSLVYGSTRDHLLEVQTILSDGSEAVFGDMDTDEFDRVSAQHTMEGRLYRQIKSFLSNPRNREEVRAHYPDPEIKRRNTGYAVDLLLNMKPFHPEGDNFNFSRLLAGSEGTLAFFTAFKLALDPIPPPVKGLVCVHCRSLEEALQGNLIALSYNPRAVELMDDTVMELSKKNLEQQKNRFFIQGDPAAMLIIEFAADSLDEVRKSADRLTQSLKDANIGTAFPLITGKDIPKVWAVRKAGLGLLSNMQGDARPVAVVEDTAVTPQKLPEYLAEFRQILDRYGLKCAYNAHIGTGELHLRPILNLKDPGDVDLFRKFADETADLVKKFRGSLSGEHGDGRLRGEFIIRILGEKNFAMLREIKRNWDPENIFNAGKIFDTPPMNTSLRFHPERSMRDPETMYDFSVNGGFLRSAEKCNGSGDCRKTAVIGGTMCPSFQATRDEKTTTRARANLLREMITWSDRENPFDHPELLEILDLCLSCKGCKSECPSNVDMAMLKSEFLHQYYKVNRRPFRESAMARYPDLYRMVSYVPGLFNLLLQNKFTSSLIKMAMGVDSRRSMPEVDRRSMKRWLNKNNPTLKTNYGTLGKVRVFVDEFTRYNDVSIGVQTIQLLKALGYEVDVADCKNSGRTYISKGLLKKAHTIAGDNVEMMKSVLQEDISVVGIEPSAILSFRDEYPVLLRGELQATARELAKKVFTIDEFIAREIRSGNIGPEKFTTKKQEIRFHGHCQQKALSSSADLLEMLSIPSNYHVEEVPSGCCGMAGSFGYEKEHYDLSMKIGEMVLFPEVRKMEASVLLVAAGTSCRHQILDGTGKKAMHPVEVLFQALKSPHD